MAPTLGYDHFLPNTFQFSIATGLQARYWSAAEQRASELYQTNIIYYLISGAQITGVWNRVGHQLGQRLPEGSAHKWAKLLTYLTGHIIIQTTILEKSTPSWRFFSNIKLFPEITKSHNLPFMCCLFKSCKPSVWEPLSVSIPTGLQTKSQSVHIICRSANQDRKNNEISYWLGLSLRGLGPRANYTDRANAACRRISANFCG
jgi:hypothetical protein